ncbi:hypothetical protein [Candidatus Borrarchaeum sp.]|uniref:hypothetical protein n=1 Tax=Candidatus Borrarchaeum sp. TaxID=2846742 RepID=UPI002579DCC6|nr:hypothetical protein [Candidatus Borrarchaeum sp.]
MGYPRVYLPVTDWTHTSPPSSLGNDRSHDLSKAKLSTQTPTRYYLTPPTGYITGSGSTRRSTVLAGTPFTSFFRL